MKGFKISKNNILKGKVFLKDKEIILDKESDELLVGLIKSFLEKGIPVFSEYTQDKKNISTLQISHDLSLSTIYFLLKNLNESGYEVDKFDSAIDEYVDKLISQIPGELKKKIIKELPENMTYLEKTYLIDQIEKNIRKV